MCVWGGGGGNGVWVWVWVGGWGGKWYVCVWGGTNAVRVCGGKWCVGGDKLYVYVWGGAWDVKRCQIVGAHSPPAPPQALLAHGPTS